MKRDVRIGMGIMTLLLSLLARTPIAASEHHPVTKYCGSNGHCFRIEPPTAKSKVAVGALLDLTEQQGKVQKHIIWKRPLVHWPVWADVSPSGEYVVTQDNDEPSLDPTLAIYGKKGRLIHKFWLKDLFTQGIAVH